MCYGLFIATGSFFLGQQQVFPAFLRGSPFLTLPALLPLHLLIYGLLPRAVQQGLQEPVIAQPGTGDPLKR
jgi:hypothetical protein